MSIVRVSRDINGPYFLLENSGDLAAGGKPVEIRVEFDRRGQIGLRTDLLARAIGYKKNLSLKILDGTAGLCRDSFHFFCLGCEVVALESHAQIYEVVSEQLAREVKSDKLQLIHTDAIEYLSKMSAAAGGSATFDVIYLDPIFQEKQKSAKAGKESELLRALAPRPSENDESRLLESALKSGVARVVVKRPLRAAEMAASSDLSAHILSMHAIKGSAVRYDVYLTK